MPSPLHAGPPVADADALRRRLALHHGKWDPQVGDVATVAPFPLCLRRSQWLQLAGWAERLAAELAAVERELSHRPELHRDLGLPRRVRWAIGPAAVGPRLVRFDFHWTANDGWRLSEANPDVPGGLCEASALPALLPGRPAGDPAAAWADAVAAAAVTPDVALLTAPGFMEDHQVMAHLADRLRERGCRPHPAGPGNVRWDGGRPSLSWAGPLGAVVRFVQAEWLPRWTGWPAWFAPSPAVPLLNPATAVLVESKRLPLVWDRLRTPVPTWRALLPDTVDPRAVRSWGDGWVLKGAYGNTGDAVAAAAWVDARRWRRARRSARLWPRRWAAQRPFATAPVDTPIGPRFPCVGVYTVAGKAAGAYGRLSVGPIVDYAAVDVGVTVVGDDGQAGG